VWGASLRPSSLEPWIAKHSPDELAELVPALRLAWIRPPQLRELFTVGLLSSIGDIAMVQQALDDALERQAQCTRIRKNPCADDNHDDALQCPITHEIMRDPVMATDGHTYERTAIEEWFANNDSSPKTNNQMESKALIPNHAVKKIVAERAEKDNAPRARKRIRFTASKLPISSHLASLLIESKEKVKPQKPKSRKHRKCNSKRAKCKANI